ncbi:FAD-dependent oxidoreductase [Bacillus horti]|uniref:Thioredoxin reductase/bacterioferritin-associated ferredoxin n=1 Tax=Caldalkalibacillus horti TaxID=77523 RepID=A0ABT9W4F2_9BACI|nr:FAD-dependent oxidoreductase [Bacillus horti]MDQ0167972.1 thioredoxin reductase/bacterioferritin-associated ferredoxin [Bacillus horti]
MSEKKSLHVLEQQITINIDHNNYAIPKGYSLATAISEVKGLGYRQTRFGDVRGPVCNMGVCFECSVYVQGKGNIRACMIEVEEGMVVHTTPDFEQLSMAEGEEEGRAVGADGEGNRHIESNLRKNTAPYDVAIIGAGPAGLGAGEELSGKGLRVVLIEEQQASGGQIYRQASENFQKQHVLSPNPLVQRVAEKQDVYRIFGATVWSISTVNEEGNVSTSEHDRESYLIHLENEVAIQTKQIILATGAYDRLFPFQGWTKPGVMSAGGLQIFAKTQRYIPGKAILLAGSHPFILIVAKQILQMGGQIKGIAFAQGFPKLHELFTYGMSGLRRWRKSKELLSALQAVRKAKVPLWFNTIPLEAEGDDQVERLKLARLNQNGEVSEESAYEVQCDVVGLCYGFTASSELARQIGCKTRFDGANGGWLVEVNEEMQSSIPTIRVAGELNGVGGAELSEVEGRIAALSLLKELSPQHYEQKKAWHQSLIKERSSWMAFAEMLGKATDLTFDPLPLLKRKPETYVCRCEEVSYRSIEDTLQEHSHVSSMNAVKLMTRCGMGLCQGRYCERTLQEIASHQWGEKAVGDSLTARFPVKPVTIKQMVKQLEKTR